ncbi:MAG: hypothetical protein WCA27_13135 [Candidatus Sulfotelmatobacter sp.]
MSNIIDEIVQRPKPGDTANWWGKQDPKQWAAPLDDEESGDLEFFTSSDVAPTMRIGRGIADAGSLTKEERERAQRLFGDDSSALTRFANFENRRRIIAHYVLTHPATIEYEIQLYRLSRDVNPFHFIVERVYEVATGREMFTDEKVSRLAAGAELLLAFVVGRILRSAGRATLPAAAPVKDLTAPIYDLPPEGGGMSINGRWYTEHALERMAPDTPQIRAEIRARTMARVRKLGLEPNSPAYDPVLKTALKRIDPRGVPPSVVENEIQHPGSTNVDVITVKRGSVVVTVKPR